MVIFQRNFPEILMPDSAGAMSLGLRRVKFALEILLLIVVAWLISRLVIVAITPASDMMIGPVETAQISSQPTLQLEDDYGVLTRYDAFRGRSVDFVEGSDPTDAPETTMDIVIAGYFATDDGGGSIILDRSGSKKTLLVGDEIEPGIVLEKIEQGRAIINRNGVREIASFQYAETQSVSSPSVNDGATVIADTGPIDLERIAEVFVLKPVRGGGGTFAVSPGRDQVAFYATGLSEGDIIQAINGRAVPADPERLLDVLSTVDQGQDIRLVVDRGGMQTAVSFNVSELR